MTEDPNIKRFYAIFGGLVLTLAVTAFFLIVPDWDRPPVQSVQTGYRGIGMAQVYNPRELVEQQALNAAPEPLPPWPAAEAAYDAKGGVVLDRLEPVPEDQKARNVYENVQVLGDLDADQFIRLMSAITEWVAPEQGCEYCHNLENLALDEPYTKIVSRRMFQMTQAINTNWGSHVYPAGVTCYTCHRGQPVPQPIWYRDGEYKTTGLVGQLDINWDFGAENVYDYFSEKQFEDYLLDSKPLNVQSLTALPASGTPAPAGLLDDTQYVYELMMQMSDSLGVNCTFCHNSRALANWGQSNPARSTAWYGINMAAEINTKHIEPLASVFPPERLGEMGDPGKVYCKTCHKGAWKPLYGANMVVHYPSLGLPRLPLDPAERVGAIPYEFAPKTITPRAAEVLDPDMAPNQ
ncbi:photosynthetic reaction center cytochrome PufC [Caenispirillum salinarum]|uniref:photosynthetic reaction center cytochrome PufC n=1 Tax=Caenispirillum salinarum TaxID=859058 RepID=UPI00384B3C2F